MPYTLYIGNYNYSSWSLRPWALLNFVGVPFESVEVVVNGQGTASGLHSAYSPNGLVPCLHDDGFAVPDSLAIMEYINDKHPEAGVWPKDLQARARARCVAAEMHSGFGALRSGMPMNIKMRLKGKPHSVDLARDIARIEQIWSECVTASGGPFLFGDKPCAADAMYVPVAFRFLSYNVTLTSPVAEAYKQTLLAHPVVREWEAAALLEEGKGLKIEHYDIASKEKGGEER
jgi:glutathione S-transferase